MWNGDPKDSDYSARFDKIFSLPMKRERRFQDSRRARELLKSVKIFIEFFYVPKYRLSNRNAIADANSMERVVRETGFTGARRGRKRRKFSREKCNCRSLADAATRVQLSASLNGIQRAKVSVQRSASNGSTAQQEIIYEPSN